MNRKRETYSERKERYKEKIKNLTMMSDILARKVLKDRDVCEYVLGVLMGDKSIHVETSETQADYRSLHGRGVVLDCVAGDDRGRTFNVEIQQDDEGAHPKRARYHLGMLDSNTLNPGESFDKLPETYIIFVTRDDTLGLNLPIAHIDRTVQETSTQFKDEAHIIYVDASREDENTELGRLMRDFNRKNASDMQDSVLAERIRELKETEKGVEHMCKEMEEIHADGIREGFEDGKAVGREIGIEVGKREGIEAGRKEGIEAGRKEGIEAGRKEGIEAGRKEGIEASRKEIAQTMASEGMSIEMIAKMTKTSVETIQKWLAEA